jgi:alkaline phosphatase D
MNKSLCLHITLFILFALTPHDLQAYKFGLGSCLHQDQEQAIWKAIKLEEIDSFIFLGDNVYGDTQSGNLKRMKKAYAKQKLNLPRWLVEKEILSIWDDHDYGLNDGGSSYQNKVEAQELFVDFWKIPPEDPRRKREGIYFESKKSIEGLKVHMVGLDTRYFRSNLEKGEKKAYIQNLDPGATILGLEQWTWLERVLKTSSADVIVLLSSIQILASNHPYEKWTNFPLERLKLLEMVEQFSRDKIIIAISGDRHRSGIYQYKNFIELTASGLNKAGSKNTETDPLLLNNTYPEFNFGLLDIEPLKKQLTLSIHDVEGVELESLLIPLK